MGFGLAFVGVGIVILSWEKFKEGYEGSVSKKE